MEIKDNSRNTIKSTLSVWLVFFLFKQSAFSHSKLMSTSLLQSDTNYVTGRALYGSYIHSLEEHTWGLLSALQQRDL